ncbi:cupin domain-containing protein [Limosilactobacillus fermentum]|uniref:Cupin n=1 Tax=Limosilactobacillus fermentum NB-22 TaxID=1408443 RepID=A0A829LX60_LIMFE|nr:cupin domain-containing protein [Limosilactobacillus fermentum]ESS02150.1 cupin [Limosilactobacillus fermentum NB-22]KPH22422.1 cupin [Limosilactobacillus fermentum]MCH5394934.1 cupin domain-containing protein [Limosilactobacillus fermentum]MCQ2008338.1 cupin domain-containing protein [Limosilactobacillus fermentum]MDA3723215.1 cupin domain-containing protein [Limosilactobacillus fermentum]
MAKNEEAVKNDLFGFGDKNVAFAKYFIGDSYLNSLISADDNIDVHVANVSFEPDCRNNWHVHHNGYQLLLVTAGEGWYQEFGKPAQKLHPGDAVAIHEGVKHWHGATKDSWFSHIAITKGSSEWLEEVSDADYAKLAD